MKIKDPNHKPLDQISNTEEDFALTPQIILNSFSVQFDLDPCASFNEAHHFAQENWANDSQAWAKNWSGMVFLHPPANSDTGRWIAKMRKHNNGILLYKQSRLDRQAYKKHIKGRIKGSILLDRYVEVPYTDPTGEVLGSYPDRFNFYAYGSKAAQILAETKIPGVRHFLDAAYATSSVSYKPQTHQHTEDITSYE